MNHLNSIFQTLGINSDNGLYCTGDTKWKAKLQFPNRVIRLLEKNIKPYAFFCIDNKPLILFFENPTNKQDLHKKIWNFNESPVVIIVDNGAVEIFNGFKLIESGNDSGFLERIGGEEVLSDFSYFQLVTGKTWEKYQDELNHKNRVDYKLLENIGETRKRILTYFPPTDDKETVRRYTKITNALLGKIIFVRYLINRNVNIYFDGESRKRTNDEFCEILKQPARAKEFFDSLADDKVGFNGDLFPLEDAEYDEIPRNAYQILINLLTSQEISTGQLSLFDLYDFSIIPVEFISNIYESFIGKENQEKEGAYYTPLFLVDYILSETVEKFISKNDTYNCKVLDPACGSGVFLVETLRKLIEKYIETTPDDSERFKKGIKTIVQNNIFGVDKDESAVQVAVFSIYLTLLDYMNPPEIADFRFPNLMNTNFFCADFFDETKAFNSVLKQNNRDLDFIVGNPPWKGGALGSCGTAYIKRRREKEKVENKKYLPVINNGEIAEGFILRVSDFSSPETQFALIVRSSILYNRGYNIDYSGFRRYWLEEFFINKIVELAPVRHDIFDNRENTAIAPAAILFYRYANGKDTNDNVLEHLTIKPSRFFLMFKIFSIYRHDIQSVQQDRLKQYDWLWKTLVYGSYLDFNLIKYLKENNTSVKDLISNSEKFISGTGIHYGKISNYDATRFHSCPFIDAYTIEPYFINQDKIVPFMEDKVHRIRNENLFKAPVLLIRKGPDTKLLTLKSAICTQDAVYKDTLTAVKAFSEDDIKYLRNIEAVLHSDLYAYFAINCFASIGIEREQIQDYDKFSVPYIESDMTVSVETIEQAKAELHDLHQQIPVDNIKCSNLRKIIDEAQNKINETILQTLHFDEREKSLLDYAMTVNRPIITRTKKDESNVLNKLQQSLPKHSPEIISYANVYLDRFKRNLDNDERKFVVRIWHTNQLLAMFFEVVPVNTPEENGIIWDEIDNKQILSLLIRLSSEKLTDSLFVQKDIRGFEKERFYVFKPNEKRLWHKAIAYLDVDEFMDAILRAGGRGE